MSLFDNIIEALQEFKNDIISSLKNEIMNLKQEIININKEKDEEINILKQELLKIRQELKQSQLKEINYRKEILELQQLCTKLENQIPHNNLFPKVVVKDEIIINDIKRCLFGHYTNNTPCPIFKSYEEMRIQHSIPDNLFDEDEYIIFNEGSLITNKGKLFVTYNNFNSSSNCCYYYCDLNIKIMTNELFHLIKNLCCIVNLNPFINSIPHINIRFKEPFIKINEYKLREQKIKEKRNVYGIKLN
jgi:hypothetical protein